ncbi:alpha/beta fold hydrolase [Clostridium estertheticum]|uniref:alpha/beta fold hydrolase n=1 Tax=Clostridium estertheticum TaxID=238834 RepID=UPI001C6E4A93|nr:alpha/beta hydrolase [Clostridium estertheticum]MBW9152324.1 alpha/beta hydrolase [Clostridium estertheticum]WLC82818.1 alpha/beta hydrolase [Clostridium estertheticum]
MNKIIGIDTIEKVNINGINQYISIKSTNIENPLLLILHGGPGDTSLPLVHKYNRALESHYVVVVWEQRGAGKSYYKFKVNEAICIDTFVEDAFELAKILLQRFKQNKLYLIGHSWGSVIGLKLIEKHYELFHTYIGCGQVVNMRKAMKISYDYAIEKNKDKNNLKILSKLKEIDCSYNGQNWMNDLLFVTKQVVKHKGSLYNQTNWNKFIWCFLTSKEYSLRDLINRQKGSYQAIKYLWQELMTVNFEKIKQFQVPVIFIEGRYDYQVSAKVAEEYYNNITSQKRIYWFEKSCHFPQWCEASKFNDIVIGLINGSD